MSVLKPCRAFEGVALFFQSLFNLVPEFRIAAEQLKSGPRAGLQNDPRIMGERPEFRLELAPQRIGRVVPAISQVQSQLDQRAEIFGFRVPQSLMQVRHSCSFTLSRRVEKQDRK